MSKFHILILALIEVCECAASDPGGGYPIIALFLESMPTMRHVFSSEKKVSLQLGALFLNFSVAK